MYKKQLNVHGGANSGESKREREREREKVSERDSEGMELFSSRGVTGLPDYFPHSTIRLVVL